MEELLIPNNFRDVAMPEDVSLPQLVLRRAETYGDRTAFIDDATGETVSYTEFVTSCYQLAAGLYHHGLNKGDVVAIFADNMVEYATMFLGATLCGAVVTGISLHYADRSLGEVVNNANPRYVLTLPQHTERIGRVVANCSHYQETFVVGQKDGFTSYADLVTCDLDLPEIEINSRTDPALLTYTSGTTGVKKGVLATHWALMGPILWFEKYPEIAFFPPNEHSIIAALRPMTHTYGQVCFLSCGPYMGATMILTAADKVEDIFSLVEKYKVTVFPFTALPMAQWTKFTGSKNYDVTSVTSVLVGGNPLPQKVQQRFNRMYPHIKHWRQVFGTSETGCVSVTPHSYDKNGSSVGVLCPGITAKVVDPTSQDPLPVNQRGELLVKSPTNMLRYLNMEEETKQAITQHGFYKTGDIAYYDEDGNIYIVDRLKEIIDFDCIKVAPAEIEAILLDHPDIMELGVVGYPDEDYGELPRAYIVRRSGSNLTETDVHAFLNGKVADAMRLRGGVIFVADLPKTSIGKVMRKEVKATMLEEYHKNKA